MHNFAASAAQEFTETLLSYANDEKRIKDHLFYKYPLKNILGTGHTAIKKTVSNFLPRLEGLSSEEILNVADNLVKVPFLECRIAVAEILGRLALSLDARSVFMKTEGWISGGFIDNWAPADCLCNKTLAQFIIENESLATVALPWAYSPNHWSRRASAVIYVLPASKALGLDALYETALLLLRDKNDYVNKGLGWALREAAKSDKKRFLEFVENYGKRMPRVTLRYAVEKFPPAERENILQSTKSLHSDKMPANYSSKNPAR